MSASTTAAAAMTGNRDLAARARVLAEESTTPMGRRAALCVAVCLQTTKTLSAARAALAEIRLGPVRKSATQLFDSLVTTTAERETPISRGVL